MSSEASRNGTSGAGALRSEALSRIKASLLLGALGDALGAPVEIFKLPRILQLTEGRGVTELLAYDPGDYLKYSPCEQTGVGAVTDDTCMMAATAAGLLVARQEGFLGEPAHILHQAYLHWGLHQAWAEGDYYTRLDTHYAWPAWFSAFCFSSGAGKSTLAALNSGTIGTMEQPIAIPSPDSRQPPCVSEGAGGMMRVAPVGWLNALGVIKNPYHLGCLSAAITHGGATAQRASGALAYLIAELASGQEWSVAIARMLKVLAADAAASKTRELAEQALEVGHHLGGQIAFEDLERAPETLGSLLAEEGSNRFLTSCIWGQALLIMEALQRWPGTKEAIARRALTLAVTHSGDSDTLGAIVGNILGAQLGIEACPWEMLSQLQTRPLLEALATELQGIAAAH